MDPRLGSVRRDVRRAAPRALRQLEEWLRIPSISGDPARTADVARATAWVVDLLRGCTSEVAVHRATAGPVVVARTPGRRRGAPVTLVYGHLDVKAPGPGWTTPPFVPTRRPGRLQARGASDDKGQLMPHLAALQAWCAAGGPPGDVVTVVDGAEEVGSPGLARVLRQVRAGTRRPEVVLVLDTRAAGPGRPSLTLSQRGALPLSVTVETGGGPVHAGRLGGAVVDPSLELAAALLRGARAAASLTAGCTVRAASPTRADVNQAARGRALLHTDLVAATTRRGALTVSRLHAGAARGAVPTRAGAVIDVRLPPGADPGRALSTLVTALRHGLPSGVRLRVRPGTPSRGACLEPDPRAVAAVRAACVAGFGRGPVTASSGGSVQAVRVLARTFGTTPILLGLGPIDDGAHGPDEHLDLDDWTRALDTHAVLLDTVVSAGPRAKFARVPSSARRATLYSVDSWGSRDKASGVT